MNSGLTVLLLLHLGSKGLHFAYGVKQRPQTSLGMILGASEGAQAWDAPPQPPPGPRRVPCRNPSWPCSH